MPVDTTCSEFLPELGKVLNITSEAYNAIPFDLLTDLFEQSGAEAVVPEGLTDGLALLQSAGDMFTEAAETVNNLKSLANDSALVQTQLAELNATLEEGVSLVTKGNEAIKDTSGELSDALSGVMQSLVPAGFDINLDALDDALTKTFDSFTGGGDSVEASLTGFLVSVGQAIPTYCGIEVQAQGAAAGLESSLRLLGMLGTSSILFAFNPI